MSFHRLGLRMAQQSLRRQQPAFRMFTRRLTTEELKAIPQGGKLVGPADNAFNRERAAVKAHANATAGTSNFPRRGLRCREAYREQTVASELRHS